MEVGSLTFGPLFSPVFFRDTPSSIVWPHSPHLFRRVLSVSVLFTRRCFCDSHFLRGHNLPAIPTSPCTALCEFQATFTRFTSPNPLRTRGPCGNPRFVLSPVRRLEVQAFRPSCTRVSRPGSNCVDEDRLEAFPSLSCMTASRMALEPCKHRPHAQLSRPHFSSVVCLPDLCLLCPDRRSATLF